MEDKRDNNNIEYLIREIKDFQERVLYLPISLNFPTKPNYFFVQLRDSKDSLVACLSYN